MPFAPVLGAVLSVVASAALAPKAPKAPDPAPAPKVPDPAPLPQMPKPPVDKNVLSEQDVRKNEQIEQQRRRRAGNSRTGINLTEEDSTNLNSLIVKKSLLGQ